MSSHGAGLVDIQPRHGEGHVSGTFAGRLFLVVGDTVSNQYNNLICQSQGSSEPDSSASVSECPSSGSGGQVLSYCGPTDARVLLAAAADKPGLRRFNPSVDTLEIAF